MDVQPTRTFFPSIIQNLFLWAQVIPDAPPTCDRTAKRRSRREDCGEQGPAPIIVVDEVGQ